MDAIILFEEITANRNQQISKQAIKTGDHTMDTVVGQLEEELKQLKSRLRNTIEQYETSSEELKASNEELQAINEELRSTSEELETGKEELQSVNEELTTVNNELKEKVEEIGNVNSDLENLIRSTHIATIFLDKRMKIKRYTPPVTDIFNLIATDIGRPLSDITHRLHPDHFQQDAEEVLRSLQPKEREVSSDDGNFFMVRLSPYRTVDDRIDGVVISFIDITKREKTLQVIKDERSFSEGIISTLHEQLLVLDKDLRIVSANRSFYETYHFSKKETEGSLIFEVGEGRWDHKQLREMLETVLPKKKKFVNKEITSFFKGLGKRNFLININEIQRKYGEERLILMAFEDITERKLAEQLVKDNQDRKTFLLQLNDALHSQLDSEALKQKTTHLILNYFKVDRCFYGEIRENEMRICSDAFKKGASSINGTYPLKNWMRSFWKHSNAYKNPVVIDDIHNSNMISEKAKDFLDRKQFVSLVKIPIKKKKEGLELLCCIQNETRKWENTEVDLLSEAAERIETVWNKIQTEEKLALSEKKYHTLFESMDEGYCIVEVFFNEKEEPSDYRFLEVNDAFERQTGLENVIGKRIREVSPELEYFWYEKYGKVALTGEPVSFEGYTKASNRYYEVYAYRLGDREKHLVAILFNNISDRKKSEQKLKRSEESYRIIVNQANVGIVKTDLSGKIVYCNEHFSKMLSYTPGELRSKSINDLIYEEDQPIHKLKLKKLLEDRKGYMIEKRMVDKEGKLVWVNNYNSPTFINEKLDSFTIISLDITQQKKMEQHKDQFIGMASHELKTPLTSIKALAEILQEVELNNRKSESGELINKLNRQVDKLNKLIYDLLDTTQITEGKFELQSKNLELNAFLKNFTSDAQSTISSHDIIFKPEEEVTVFADPNRLEQVLTNLMTNAVKYSPDADQIIISTEKSGNRIKVCFRDFGIGLAIKEKEKIFKRFYRINSNSNVSGFGLGLSISYEIIKLHGGEMGVEIPEKAMTSENNVGETTKGSIFYFTLPLRKEEK